MNWMNVIFLIYQVIAIIMDNRQPAKTMAWALVIWFVPVVGIVFYLFFGINTRKERHVSERSMNQLTKRSMLEFAEQQNLRLPDKHKPLIDLFVNQNFSLPFKGTSSTSAPAKSMFEGRILRLSTPVSMTAFIAFSPSIKTLYMLFLSELFSMPSPVVVLPCGSRSQRSTFFPLSASPAPRFMHVEVFPTPPF